LGCETAGVFAAAFGFGAARFGLAGGAFCFFGAETFGFRAWTLSKDDLPFFLPPARFLEFDFFKGFTRGIF